MSSYKESLEAAGAEVLAFESFGSYQGDWVALVNYNGTKGWVSGYYGSCSGCDAFEAEIGYTSDEDSIDYKERVKQFGEGYLEHILNTEDMLKNASKNLDWDMDAQKMVDFINNNKEL